MAEVFISYARERAPLVQHLARLIELYGYRTWFDAQLIAGKTFDDQLADKIRASKAVVVVWCGHSVASHWVKEEARLAGDKLVPTVIEHCELPLGHATIHYTDLSQWDGTLPSAQLEELFRQIAIKVGRQPRQPNAAEILSAVTLIENNRWGWPEGAHHGDKRQKGAINPRYAAAARFPARQVQDHSSPRFSP